MRFLIIPGNNSLSHGLKSISIQRRLTMDGHESIIAIGNDKAGFYRDQNASYTILPDIQEIDGSPYPTINWFRNRDYILKCIESEISLIKNYRPSRVLGVFRFTLKAASCISKIPYYSLACGCMLPHISGALGFHNDTDDPAGYRDFINMFFRSAGIKMNSALSHIGINPIEDIRAMLIGERTFLWDIPEFMPLSPSENIIHTGPLSWNDKKQNDIELDSVIDDSRPLAVLAFGTCNGNIRIITRMTNILDDLGYSVVIAAGGQEKLLTGINCDLRAKTYLFAPIEKMLTHASLIVCHGGQMTVFEALSHEIPIAVIPFHPEQAHNGLCLERAGCGRMLTPACRFIGNSAVYMDALEKTGDDQIKNMISGLVNDPATKENLRRFKKIIDKYDGLKTLTGHLVN